MYYGLSIGSAILMLPGCGISRSTWVGQLPQGPNQCTLGGAAGTGHPRPPSGKERRLLGPRSNAPTAQNGTPAVALPQRYGAYVTPGWSPKGQAEQILTHIEGCLGIDPGDLLEEGQVLLQVDFERLPRSSATKLEWIVGMDTAMGAVEHIASGSCHALRTRYCRGSRPRMRLEYEAVQVDQEGSLRWRRQRKWV